MKAKDECWVCDKMCEWMQASTRGARDAGTFCGPVSQCATSSGTAGTGAVLNLL